MTVTSIAFLFAFNNHQGLDNFAQSYLLKSPLKIVELFLEKVLSIKPNTLLLSGIAAALYAVLTAIEAVGLWYEKG